MPILDVTIVGDLAGSAAGGLARRLADAAAGVFKSEPRGTWVTVHVVPPDHYAENAGGPASGVQPVFARVILRDPPRTRVGMEEQVAALTQAIATACSRPADNVHIIYEPAAGRVAFGGKLVT